MRPGERREPLPGGFRQFLRRSGGPCAQAHDAAREGENVLDPVAHFSQQQLLALAGFLNQGDVASDLGCAHDPTAGVADRRDGQGYVDQASILALTHGFKVANPKIARDITELKTRQRRAAARNEPPGQNVFALAGSIVGLSAQTGSAQELAESAGEQLAALARAIR